MTHSAAFAGATSRRRLYPALAHAGLFLTVTSLFHLSSKPLLQGPAGIPFVVLFLADFPISIIASDLIWDMGQKAAWFWAMWGVAATIWWYSLGPAFLRWFWRLSDRLYSR